MKTFFSPGRVNLIGEHIDYNGGNVLPAAIDIGTTAHVKPREDSLLVLFSKNYPDVGKTIIDLNLEMKKDNLWTDYVKGVLFILKKRGYKVTRGLDITIEGNIPAGSGLSSSASLEVLFCYIFNYYNDLKIKNELMAVISQEAENEFVGVNCGIMDQFIIACAKKDNAMLLNCNTLDYSFVECNLKEYIIAVMNTKKPRELVNSAYNQRRKECESALSKMQSKFNVKYLCDLTVEQLEKEKSLLSKIEYKRAYHVITEQQRVGSSVEYLREGNIKSFGEQIYKTHESLKEDYEVSSKELDTLVELAKKHGSIGARMIGAGFGGCAIALIQKKQRDEFEKEVLREYKDLCDLDGEIYFVKVGEGVDDDK